MPGGRPKKQKGEQRSVHLRARVTDAERESIAHEARLHGVSESEYIRRRLGIGAPASRSHSTPETVAALEKRGVDVAELFSRDYIRAQAEAAGLSEAGLVQRMLEYASAPPARRQTAALISEVNRLGLELKAIGVNANQLALATHTGQRFASTWQTVAQRIAELRGQVAETMERILDAHD